MAFPFLEECVPHCHLNDCTKLQSNFLFLILDFKPTTSIMVFLIFSTSPSMSAEVPFYLNLVAPLIRLSRLLCKPHCGASMENTEVKISWTNTLRRIILSLTLLVSKTLSTHISAKKKYLPHLTHCHFLSRITYTELPSSFSFYYYRRPSKSGLLHTTYLYCFAKIVMVTD